MEQRVEGMEVAEALTKTRSELKGLKEHWRTLSPLQWICELPHTGLKQWAECVSVSSNRI